MNLHNKISHCQRHAGIMLIECIVYLAVFLILSGVAMGSFYLCWDHSKALISASDDIGAALRAGERWRTDVRAASGTISVETTSSGETVKIPEGNNEIFYHFTEGALSRQNGAQNLPVILLHKVVSSEMTSEARGGVTAWRWELEVAQRRKEIHLPLLFTFEAVTKSHENLASKIEFRPAKPGDKRATKAALQRLFS